MWFGLVGRRGDEAGFIFSAEEVVMEVGREGGWVVM